MKDLIEIVNYNLIDLLAKLESLEDSIEVLPLDNNLKEELWAKVFHLENQVDQLLETVEESL